MVHNVAVSAYFEVLRPVGTGDLDGIDAGTAAVLERLPPDGYVSAAGLEGGCGSEAAQRALEWARRNGILHKTARDGAVMDLESVRSWLAQLNPPQMKRFSLEKGTRRTYADALGAFNSWLSGRKFPAARGAGKKALGAFQNVEELLRFCERSAGGPRAARRVAREYLAGLPASGHSLSNAMVRCSALKSYFAAYDVRVDVKVDRRRHAIHDVQESPGMGMLDFYKMMTVGSWDVMQKAVMMVKLQAGLDASTLADRFNFEAYPQIVKHFGVADCGAWDLGRCPVPVRLVRVKTGMAYTTFIDCDAVTHLQDYLGWREFQEGRKYDGTGPLFVTRRGAPVGPDWISNRFTKAAIEAGIQKRTSRRVFKIHSHEVRDLLKSTLLVSGCAQYAADHVLGHAPRDSYEKQATLYPEQLRAEYSKASGRLNMFTGIANYLGAAYAEDPRRQPEGAGDGRRGIKAQHADMQEALRRIADTVDDVLGIVAAGGEGSRGAAPDGGAGGGGLQGPLPDQAGPAAAGRAGRSAFRRGAG